VLRQLTTDGCCVMPSWSPDSKQVLFISKPLPESEVGVYALDVNAPESGVPEAGAQLVGPVGLYSPNRSLVAYPDGARTVVERLSTGERWIMPNNGQSVEFSPDSRRIAWEIEAISGPYDERQTTIYIANYDGSDAGMIARVYGGGLIGWLPKGLNLVFLGRPSLDTRDRTLTVLDLQANVALDLVTAERIGGVSASPGGSWLAYFISFNEDDERNGIWIQRSDGNDARRLDVWGAYQWRDDSHLLVIPTRPAPDRGFAVWEVDAASGEQRQLTDGAVTPLHILNGDWRVSPDGQSIVFVNSLDRNLWLLELP
jgi:Tol biopolymer transport system component